MALHEINNLAQLQAITPTHLADDCVLKANIDGDGASFTPIGEAGTPFTGTFDGADYTISNLVIAKALGAGIFGYILTDGAIKDVTLTNIAVSGGAFLGILAGEIDSSAGTATVSGIAASGTIDVATITTVGVVGGLTGRLANAKKVAVSDCDFTVTITTTTYSDQIGGFVGLAGQYATIEDCTVSGLIEIVGTREGDFTSSFGGFVGYNRADIADCQCSVSLICGQQTATGASRNNAVGGFVGQNFTSGTIEKCYAAGYVLCTNINTSYVGGFVGLNKDAITECAAACVVECPNQSSSVNLARVGGFVGYLDAGNVTDCYARGSVCGEGVSSTGVYSIGGFVGYRDGGDTINCYSIGRVNLIADVFGGFMGTNAGATSTSCYWDTETSLTETGVGSGAATGVTGKTTSDMKYEATFASWDFGAVWTLLSSTQSAVAASNLSVWLSKVGDYNNFEEGVDDDNSFAQKLPTENEIRWIEALESLLVGTSGDEWKLGSNKLDTALTPLNCTQRQQSEHGSNRVQPVKVNSSVLFVDRVGRKVREMTFVEPKYESPDLTALAEHITKTGVTSIARQKNPDSILWMTLTDGSLISFTYERDQNVLAFAEHPLGGDGFAQSVCVLPGSTEDIIYLAVKRTIDSTEVVFIEKMAPRVFDTKVDAFFVDAGITFRPILLTLDAAPVPAAWAVGATITGATSGTTAKILKVRTDTTYELELLDGDFADGEIISDGTNARDCGAGYPTVAYTASAIIGELDYLEGETVKILADGVVADDAVVTDGKVTIKISGTETAAAKAHAGLAYTSILQPMRIFLGDSMSSITKIPELTVSLLDTGAAQYGNVLTDLHDVDLNRIGVTNSSEITGLFTEEVSLIMPGQFGVLTPLFIATDKPLPLTVKALIPKLEKTGR